jgi:hypothetical protein
MEITPDAPRINSMTGNTGLARKGKIPVLRSNSAASPNPVTPAIVNSAPFGAPGAVTGSG